MSRYSLEDRGTDRQTESISECTLKDLSNEQHFRCVSEAFNVAN